MKKTLIIALAVVFAAAGCGPRGANTAADATTEQGAAAAPALRSGHASVALQDGKASLAVAKTPDQSVTFAFDVDGQRHLKATLSSDQGDANIRIVQVVMPDGSTDGPFGRQMEYYLHGDGVYRLVVHENMMAGDLWGGPFTLSIELW